MQWYYKERTKCRKNKANMILCYYKQKCKTLFKCKAAVIVSKEKKQVSTLKERVQLSSSLYLGCKSRQGDLDELFRHENHKYPPVLSE